MGGLPEDHRRAVIEFACLTVALGYLLVLTARKGLAHLSAKRLLWTLAGTGWSAGVLIESMPFTSVSAGFSGRTVFAGLVGLLAGRLLARVAQAWVIAHRDWEKEEAEGREPPRLVHPVIAAGMLLSGIPVLFAWTASRHETLEFEGTPRDPETLVVRGAEPVSLEPEVPSGSAVLLVHGFLGSPADFGDLPAALQKAGHTVRVILLPGHGTRPDDLANVIADDWVKAVGDAWDELAATHERVSVVGFSLGGGLALLASEERRPERLVLVNPYVGAVATPSWCPWETTTLLAVASKVTPRVIRPDAFARVHKRENLRRLHSYRTVHLRGATQFEEVGLRLAESRDRFPPARVLLVVSEADQATPSAAGVEFVSSLPFDLTIHRDTVSDHIVFLDHGASDAVQEVVGFLAH